MFCLYGFPYDLRTYWIILRLKIILYANIRDAVIKTTATATMGTYSLIGIVFVIKRRLQRSVLLARLYFLAFNLIWQQPRRAIILFIFVFVLIKSLLMLSNSFKQVCFFNHLSLVLKIKDSIKEKKNKMC